MNKKEWEQYIEWQLAAALCIKDQDEYNQRIEELKKFIQHNAQPFARSLLQGW